MTREIIQYIQQANACMSNQEQTINSLQNKIAAIVPNTESSLMSKIAEELMNNSFTMSSVIETLKERNVGLLKKAEISSSWGKLVDDDNQNISDNAENVLYKRFGH